MKLFGRRGLDGPSLDEICALAGYTRGAFYVHFRDREDLIVAVMERTRGRMLDIMIASGHDALDLELTVKFFAEAVAAGAYPPKAGVVRLHHFLDACARSSHIRERHVALVGDAQARLASATREAQAAGRVRADVGDESVAMLLIAVVMGVEMMLEFGYPFDVRAGAATLLRLLGAK